MINEEDNKEKTDNAKDNAQESGLKDKLLKILKKTRLEIFQMNCSQEISKMHALMS